MSRMIPAPMAPSGWVRQNSPAWVSKPRCGAASGSALAWSRGGLIAMSAVPDPRVDQAYTTSMKKFTKMKKPATSMTSAWMSV